MLESLLIRNYRLFEELRIERLSRINLFAGKNNTGKTCLLEAVELHATDFHPLTIAAILERRHEYGPEVATRRDRPSAQRRIERHPVEQLFRGGRESKRIVIGSVTNPAWRCEAGIRAYAEIAVQSPALRPRLEPIDDPNDPLSLTAKRFLELGSRPVLPLDTELFEALNRLALSPPPGNTVFVPFAGLDDDEIGRLWNETSLSDERDVVKHHLTTAFPEVRDVDVTYDVDVGYEVRTKLRDGSVANIRSLGDGVSRLFALLLALVNARHGVLLIDEFECGLHWSVQPLVWKTLFDFAEPQDVQIFATTHSRDCIEAFESAWRTRERIGTFHRLEQHPHTAEIQARAYALETLSDSLDTDVEVR